MSDFLISAVSFLLAVVFAAVWGAHVFETAVVLPVWTAEPPKSVVEFVDTPYPMKLTRFFRTLVPGLYTVATIAVIVAVATGLRIHLALAIAGICGLVHLAMIILIFLPTNARLGLNPGGPGAANLDPQVVKTLVQRWVRWHFVRLGFETAGLVAALIAFKVS